MIAVVGLACFVTGFVSAWLLEMVYGSASMSRSQERMQRKVRRWQDEAKYFRSRAEQCEGDLALFTGQGPETPDWPDSDVG